MKLKTFELPSFSKALPDFRSGKDSPSGFLERCIEVIREKEPTVQAFETLNIGAARAAAKASTDRYRLKQTISPVDGCPIGIKDIIDTFDMPTQLGSPAFRGRQPQYDAACVQALRAGGAVIFGKTVTTAFACGMSNKTTNPHDPRRTPGGSSSGSGAAVGAGMLPVAIGTQTQGSTLRPASFCGVVGFKPTYGVLPLQGIHPISVTHDHLGVLGSTIDDTWRIASYISLAQSSPGHPFLHLASETPPPPVCPKRLLRLFTHGWESETDAHTREGFEGILEKMKRHGIEIVDKYSDAAAAELEESLGEDFAKACLDITAYEMKWPYRQYTTIHGKQIEQRVHDRLQQGNKMTPREYSARLKTRNAMRKKVKALLQGCDGIVSLAASGPAPIGLSNTGSRTFLANATFLGFPAFSLPLINVKGLPVGLQYIGVEHKDGTLCAHAGWMMRHLLNRPTR